MSRWVDIEGHLFNLDKFVTITTSWEDNIKTLVAYTETEENSYKLVSGDAREVDEWYYEISKMLRE